MIFNKLGSRSLLGKLNSSSTQGSTHSVTWLEPGACYYNPENFLSKWPSTNSLIHFYKRCVLVHTTVWYSMVQYGTVQYSTVQYSTVQYSTVQYSMVWYSTVQRVDFYFTMGTKCAKGHGILSMLEIVLKWSLMF